jgi:hypothetical protein
MDFDPLLDMNAIDGCTSDLAARTDRPQGYPFSKVTIYSVRPEIAKFMPYFAHASADDVPSMRKLDFKKAGKMFPEKVKEWKNDLSRAPEEFIVTASRFDATDEPRRKTTGCRKYLIEVECENQEDRWLTVQFRKAVKYHITEVMKLNIVPAIFRDTFTSDEVFSATGKMYKDETPVIPRVIVTLGNCKESLYQSLEKYGKEEFVDLPIHLRIPARNDIKEWPHFVITDGGTGWGGVVTFNVEY